MKHKVFTGIILVEIVVLALLFVTASISERNMKPERAANRELVRHFMLTDFSLWTETRYTRHPSQADRFSPFQDFPAAIEHFPAGSILPPPLALNSDVPKAEKKEHIK